MRAIALLALAGAAAAAEPRLSAGGELGLLFRDEAGGNRTVLLALAPRAALALRPDFDLAASYAFAYAPLASAVGGATTQHHRLALRGEYVYRVRAAVLSAGAGPAVTLMHTTLYDRERAVVAATIARPGLVGGLAVGVRLDRLTVRTSAEAWWTRGRTDLFVGLGATWELGGAP